ncbi:hypothetical protein M405DRAFT_810471 [Rhizopogon salebrosus TDB-379]|nr:hypothetical protein M405DRAFT_810471 [Rhizopogon salebrosus TDB-379]
MALDTHYSAKRRKLFWWTGVTITRTRQPLSILAHSMVECLRWSVSTLVNNGSAALFLVTQTFVLWLKTMSNDSFPPTNAVFLANSGISALSIFKPFVEL